MSNDDALGEQVRAAQRGDRDAVEAVLREHYDDVYRLCRRMCSNHDDAQDAAQNAMIAIARGLSGYDGRSALRTWVYRVTANACTDELRRRSRRPVPDERLSDNSDLLDAAGPGAVAGASSPGSSGRGALVSHVAADQPEAAALQAEQRRELEAALAELPEEFRLPVVLRDVSGLDYAEIAQTLDLAPGTVRSRISRGRRHLARRLLGNRTGTPVVETFDPR